MPDILKWIIRTPNINLTLRKFHKNKTHPLIFSEVSSYVRIQDVVQKTYLGRWTIGRSGERGSGISVLPARYDDDDDVGGPPSSRSLCLFWRETRRRVCTRDLDATGSRQGNARGVGKRNSEKVVDEVWCEWPVDTGLQKWPVGMRMGPVAVREDRTRWGSTPRGL